MYSSYVHFLAATEILEISNRGIPLTQVYKSYLFDYKGFLPIQVFIQKNDRKYCEFNTLETINLSQGDTPNLQMCVQQSQRRQPHHHRAQLTSSMDARPSMHTGSAWTTDSDQR